ncbi:hypothetical protein SLS60_006291 [Paraconiothyrium brasiliense]|uniref:Uncharacterized protein n=1 Tax=Paraconiothyrium brasiliense TaxID=300254 RepID=A0ABR3RB84_9PLEO
MGKLALFALYHRIFKQVEWARWTIYVAAVIGLIVPLMTPIDAILCSPPKGKPWGYPNPECSKSFSVVETGISIACSSMPTMAKFSRLQIWQGGYFLSLRTLLRSVTHRSSGGSSKTPSQAPSGRTPGVSPKKPDPYSLHLPPTTDGSITQLRLDENESIELADGSLAKLGPELRIVEVTSKSSTEEGHGDQGSRSQKDFV